MGSFNTTCFVSQQTISTDDEVIVLPILQQTTYEPVNILIKNRIGINEVKKYGYTSSTCYSTSFWGYAGPILRGTYDDYGKVIFEDTPENHKNMAYFLSELSAVICETLEGENKSHDLPLVFSSIYNPSEENSFEKMVEAMDKLWEVASEARVFVRDWKGEPVNLAFSTMHASAGKYLVDSVSKGKSWDGASLEPKSYFHHYLNKKLKEHLEIFGDKKEVSSIANFYASQIFGFDGYNVGSSEGSFIRNNYSFPDDSIEKIIQYFKENPNSTEIPTTLSSELYENLKPQIEHRYLDEGLNNLNIRLSPMVYAPQDYDNTLGNDYLEMVKSVNTTIKTKLVEKYGEEEVVEEAKPRPKL